VMTAIVSTGISRIARKVGAELGIDEVISNDVEVAEGRITGSVKVRCPFYGKGSVVRALARRMAMPLSRSACVGDGENDITMFEVVGFSIAHNPVSQEVASRADLVLRGELHKTRDILIEHYRSLI
jgi:phosphoserine phosphatase